MRDKKGSLVAVWGPGNHGTGGSTIANSIGIALQHITDKRTLIVNMGSPRNYMEQYLKNDVDARFTMDNLRSFNMNISAEHIKIYATGVNDLLHILPNCKITKEISKVEEGFYQRFLEKALEAYEIVIVDLETGLNNENEMFLNHAEVILAVMNENEIMLKEIFESNKTIREYINDDKTIPIFNGLHCQGAELRTLKRFNTRLELSSSYGICFDTQVNKAACCEGKLYSFLKKELNKKSSNIAMVEQIKELSSIIAERLFIPEEDIQYNSRLFSVIFPKRKHLGEIDV
jgi:Flp pilus assembly CpaE family ATPase